MKSRNDLYIFDFGGTLTPLVDEEMANTTIYQNMMKTRVMNPAKPVYEEALNITYHEAGRRDKIDTLQSRIVDVIIEHANDNREITIFQIPNEAREFLQRLLKNSDNKINIVAGYVTSEYVAAVLKHNDFTDDEISRINIVDRRQHAGNFVKAGADIVLTANGNITSARIYCENENHGMQIGKSIDNETKLNSSKALSIPIQVINNKPGDFNAERQGVNVGTNVSADKNKTSLLVSPTGSMFTSRASKAATAPTPALSEEDNKLAFNTAKQTLIENLTGYIKLNPKEDKTGMSIFTSTLIELQKANSNPEMLIKFSITMRSNIERMAHENPFLEEMKKEFLHVTKPFIEYKQDPNNLPKFAEARQELYEKIKTQYPEADAKKMRDVLYSSTVKSENDFLKVLDNMQKLFCKSKNSPLIPLLQEAKDEVKGVIRFKGPGF